MDRGFRPACSALIVAAALLVGCQEPLALGGASSLEVAEALVATKRVPGFSYAVLIHGEVSSSGDLGVADLKTGETLRSDMLFEAASLTKPVIAAIAMRLFEAGVYDLDESVSSVVEAPRVRDRTVYALVTPRHLLSHSSGLPNWSGNPLHFERRNALKFKFQPGQGFSYSGEGYGLLLEFLERKSGRSMEDLSRELFEELGMSHTTLVGANGLGVVVRGHWGRSPSRKARRFDRPIAAFSLLTNAQDYVRFLRYEASGSALSPETVAEFRKRHVTIEDSDAPDDIYTLGWSLGWGVLERPESVVYFQWGDNGPFRALAAFSRSRGDGIVYFANGSNGLIDANAFVRPVLGDMSPAIEWFNHPVLEVVRKIIRY